MNKEKQVIELKAYRKGSKFHQLFDNPMEAKKKYDELKSNEFVVEWNVHNGLTIDEFRTKYYNFGAL